MKVLYARDGWRYYDDNGVPLYEGDVVVLPDGKWKILYATGSGQLGTDATNPLRISAGLDVPCEAGIYPLESTDHMTKCPCMDKVGSWFNELSIALLGKVHFTESGEYTGETLKLKEIVDELIFSTTMDEEDLFKSAAKLYSKSAK